MLEIRDDQLEALRTSVRAAIPATVLGDLRGRGIEAEQEADTGAVAATDARGFTTRLFFHDDGLPARLQFPSGSEYRFDNDADGRVALVEHSGGARVELDRDGAGRIVGLRRPGLDEHGFEHDGDGRLVAIRYPDGTRTQYDYDDQGQLVAVTDRLGARTEYERDSKGQRVAILDPMGQCTRFELQDDLLEAVVFPDGSREEYGFDAEAAAGVVTRRDGSEVYQELNEAGALREIIWPDGSFVTYDVDDDGSLRSVSNETGWVSFESDPRGNPVREKTPQGITKLGYDDDGRLTELSTPGGGTVRYRYDGDGRLSAIVDWQGREHRFGYAPDGTVGQIRYGNGNVERRRHGGIGKLEHATVTTRNGRQVSEQRYQYDADERLTELEDLDEAMGYQRRLGFDAEGRLQSSLNGSGQLVERFEYDSKGTMLRDGGRDLTIGLLDEITRYGDEAVDYDGLGNMTRLPGQHGPIECRWAADGQLAETRVGAQRTRYETDPLGRRIGKTDGRRSWRYGWVGHQLLWEEFQEAPGSEPVRRDYLWCPDSVVPVGFREAGRTYWLQTDARGAVIRAFREDGSVAWAARYDAFGQAHVATAQVRQPWRLAGQYRDEETGLHYSLCRYYSPHLKSYLSRDPLWHQPGATHYSYARNNPYNLSDPFGGLAFLLGALAAVAIGAAVGAIAAAVTGGDPVAGAIEGGMAVVGAVVGGLLGGPAGMVAGGMLGNSAGAFVGSVVEQARKGDPICLKCAAKAAAVATAFDVALLGLGKIPGVRRVVRAVGTKLYRASRPMRRWASKTVSRLKYRMTRNAKVFKTHVDPELSKAAEMDVLVPDDPKGVERAMNRARDNTRKKIGDVDIGDPKDAKKWRNTANSADGLAADAKATEPLLREIVDDSAKAAGGTSNYGPDDAFATKSKKSMLRKHNDKGTPYNEMSDAVRGTVIVDKPEQVGPAIDALQKKVDAAGGKLIVDNKFNGPNDVGYSAVHADLELPTPDGGTVRSEVQVHLKSLHDGTPTSIKESSHKIYDVTREAEKFGLSDAASQNATAASQNLWLQGLSPHGG
ncbi:MAG: hypothetical protein JRI68_20615 [Deltaproteobacteria bacterium]|nr:hypothetical protein [Deltaproteobacteria bacterium]